MKNINWIVGLPNAGKTDHIIWHAKNEPDLVCDNIERRLKIHLEKLGFLGFSFSWNEAVEFLKKDCAFDSLWVINPELPVSSLDGMLNSFIQIIGISQKANEVWIESNVNTKDDLAACTRTLDRLSMPSGYKVKPLTGMRGSCLHIQFDADLMWQRIEEIFDIYPQFPLLDQVGTSEKVDYGF